MHTEQNSQKGRKKNLPTLYPPSVLPPLLGMYSRRGTAYRTGKESILCFQSTEEITELLLL